MSFADLDSLATALGSFDSIALGEDHFCLDHRIIAREVVRRLKGYTLAVEMLAPQDPTPAQDWKLTHQLLVRRWGHEYFAFEDAAEKGYLAVLMQAERVQGIGCYHDLKILPGTPDISCALFEMYDARLQENLGRIEGKKIVYCGEKHLERMEVPAKVLLQDIARGEYRILLNAYGTSSSPQERPMSPAPRQ